MVTASVQICDLIAFCFTSESTSGNVTKITHDKMIIDSHRVSIIITIIIIIIIIEINAIIMYIITIIVCTCHRLRGVRKFPRPSPEGATKNGLRTGFGLVPLGTGPVGTVLLSQHLGHPLGERLPSWKTTRGMVLGKFFGILLFRSL